MKREVFLFLPFFGNGNREEIMISEKIEKAFSHAGVSENIEFLLEYRLLSLPSPSSAVDRDGGWRLPPIAPPASVFTQ